MDGLLKIPYVKGLPEFDGQQRITFVRNGDKLMGATTKYGHDGVLNAASSEIQENIIVLDKNLNFVYENGSTNTIEIEKIKKYIDETGSLELIEQVKENTQDILDLETAIIDTNTEFGQTKTDVDTLKLWVGVRPPEAINTTVFGDLQFIKIRVGNEKDQDINGNPSQGNEASGLIKRVDDMTKQAVKNRDDIVEIKLQLEESDPESTKDDVDQLRKEIGPVAVVDEKTIKVRLGELDTKTDGMETEISEIKDSIGFGSIDVADEIAAMKLEHDALDKQLNDPTTGLVVVVNKNTTTIGDNNSGLVKKVNDNKKEIDNLGKQLNDPTSGMLKNLNDLNTFTGLGNDNPNDQSTLNGKINVLTALSNDLSASVQDLQVEVGNNTSGIKGDIVAIKAKQTNFESRISTLESNYTALELRVKALETPTP